MSALTPLNPVLKLALSHDGDECSATPDSMKLELYPGLIASVAKLRAAASLIGDISAEMTVSIPNTFDLFEDGEIWEADLDDGGESFRVSSVWLTVDDNGLVIEFWEKNTDDKLVAVLHFNQSPELQSAVDAATKAATEALHAGLTTKLMANQVMKIVQHGDSDKQHLNGVSVVLERIVLEAEADFDAEVLPMAFVRRVDNNEQLLVFFDELDTPPPLPPGYIRPADRQVS